MYLKVSGAGIHGQWPWYWEPNGLYGASGGVYVIGDGSSVLWPRNNYWMITPDHIVDEGIIKPYTQIDWDSPWGPNHYRSSQASTLTGNETWYSAGANASNANPPPTVSILPDPEWWSWWGWWLWWDGDAAFYGSNSTIAPCAATLGGSEYLVLPLNETTTSGFVTFPLVGQRQFSLAQSASALFATGEYDEHQGGGAFDGGDGGSIHVTSGPWLDGGVKKFTFSTYSVTPGVSATQTATVDVTLSDLSITNMVEAATGDYRFVLVDIEGGVHFCTYAGGASIYTAGTGVALPALPDGYTDVTLPNGLMDQSLMRQGNTYHWMRHCVNGSSQHRVVAYEVSNGTLMGVDDAILFDATDHLQTWGSNASDIYGTVGTDEPNLAAVEWQPGHDAVEGQVVPYPNARGWYVTAGGVLYMMGWTDEDYEHRPYVVKMSPTPITQSHGVSIEWGGGMLPPTPSVTIHGKAALEFGSSGHITVSAIEAVELHGQTALLLGSEAHIRTAGEVALHGDAALALGSVGHGDVVALGSVDLHGNAGVTIASTAHASIASAMYEVAPTRSHALWSWVRIKVGV